MDLVSRTGRALFALAIVAFGVICVVTRDVVSALEPLPASTSGRGVFAIATAVVLVALGALCVRDSGTRERSEHAPEI